MKNVLPVLFLILLMACNARPVAENITQQQANRIIAMLNKNGISSYAEKGNKNRYAIVVRGRKYLQAVSLLDQHNLPADSEMSFSDLISQGGLIPGSRRMEALKVDRAMALEIEEALNMDPGILSSRVLVRYAMLERKSPAVAVVFEQHAGVDVSEEKLRSLILKTVPGVKGEDIVINGRIRPTALDQKPEIKGAKNLKGAVITVPLVPFLLWEVPEGVSHELMIYFSVIIALILLLSGGIGYVIGSYRGKGQKVREPELRVLSAGVEPLQQLPGKQE